MLFSSGVTKSARATTTPSTFGSLSTWFYIDSVAFNYNNGGYRPYVGLVGNLDASPYTSKALVDTLIQYTVASSTLDYWIKDENENHILVVEDLQLDTWYNLKIQFDISEWQFRATINDYTWSDWTSMDYVEEIGNISYINEVYIVQNYQTFYIDNFGSDNVFYEEPPYSDVTKIGSYQFIYREYDTTPPPPYEADWGMRFSGYNPEMFTDLNFSLYNASSTLIATSTVDLTYQPSGFEWAPFVAYFEAIETPLGSYYIETDFYNSVSGATTTPQNFSFILSLAFDEMLKSDWTAKNLSYIEPAFDDIWGLGDIIWGKISEIQAKFPFSWFWGVYDIWDTAIVDYGSATSTTPLQISWTMPTSTPAMGGTTFMLFDLKTVSEDYSAQITVFRDLLTFVVWLTTFFFIVQKSRSFINQLND